MRYTLSLLLALSHHLGMVHNSDLGKLPIITVFQDYGSAEDILG